ncbi:MAG: Asp-tRNA(Asn)/Glu-tRNA(Gln) amidotransferase subunit GatC [Chloroflexi bacterium]|nr:Asp-tRNA(Asn)/Glu-tRNA(Gln) amidotransferase subunit GatC [Chloroflexota bacterium]MCH8093269.1 Asp-tRNA(Asn)/Glu-tRNA(Gln) amidotransferase subunit GatC [Chloroflexota bacterium]MCH8339795.1 Asp-tRNA(Asn)/Glu-tRNA(Gln) amidotransferase subunit GatC [Chloroflexota bacterium]MCI0853233.1 Asp-tRNA(Asn)/Glu-tRNA(Gln) amidotransferase subunit GatC [Chloroflexota bacterium]MCI0861344.1 Asp-tRNA(Asn)/Glu-tRNA(Gln) amidotransferase subunit GatC [Chloroflexota bacterium]
MALTHEEVRAIAHLARLQLTDEEVERFAGQLSDVLDYAARLNEVDTSEISPTASVLPMNAPLRPDEVRPCPPRDQLLANAPDPAGGMFRVPRVLELEP